VAAPKNTALEVVGLTGIEPGQTYVPSVAERREKPAVETTQSDATQPEVLVSPSSNAVAPTDTVEAALANALTQAATAGRFDVVAQLARELEARRLARAGNVVLLDAGRRRGGA
jgi:hypothetical protein